MGVESAGAVLVAADPRARRAVVMLELRRSGDFTHLMSWALFAVVFLRMRGQCVAQRSERVNVGEGQLKVILNNV